MRTTRRSFAQSLAGAAFATDDFKVDQNEERIAIDGAAVSAAIRKKGYVSGVAAGSFLDKKTGFRDPGFGLDIVDWLMEPGSDEAYRNRLPNELIYEFDNPLHGGIPKRSIEGPQICTQARELKPRVTRGAGFAGVQQQFRYRLAAPGKRSGSEWTQTLVFPAGRRWFASSDRVVSANDSEALFLRVDMPGHVKHLRGDTFSEIYLSYQGRIPAREFLEDFAPDKKYLYRRTGTRAPKRFVRAVKLRDTATGAAGPWLAALVLDPAVVHEAWCHQRGYVCMILEFGGRPVKAGQSFSAAWIIGYFDSIGEMEELSDRHADAVDLDLNADGWRFALKPLGGT